MNGFGQVPPRPPGLFRQPNWAGAFGPSQQYWNQQAEQSGAANQGVGRGGGGGGGPLGWLMQMRNNFRNRFNVPAGGVLASDRRTPEQIQGDRIQDAFSNATISNVSQGGVPVGTSAPMGPDKMGAYEERTLGGMGGSPQIGQPGFQYDQRAIAADPQGFLRDLRRSGARGGQGGLNQNQGFMNFLSMLMGQQGRGGQGAMQGLGKRRIGQPSVMGGMGY